MPKLSAHPPARRLLAGVLGFILLCSSGLLRAQSAPAAPSNVTVGVTRIVTGVGESQSYLVRWRDNSLNESYFIIQVRIGLVGPYTDLTGALVGANNEAQIVNLSTFPAGTLLQWRLVAVSDPTTGNGQLLNGDETKSAPSSPAIVVIPAVPTFNAPTSFTASLIGDGLLQLAWTDNSTTEEAFEIQYKLSSASDAAYASLSFPAFEQNPIALIPGLLPGQSYNLRIRALRAGSTSGNSTTYGQMTGFSNTATVVMPALSPPTGFTISLLAENSARFRWQDNSFNEGVFDSSGSSDGGYAVFSRPSGSSGAFTFFGVASANTELADTHVIPGVATEWQVKARYRNGSTLVDSAASNTVTFTPPFHAPTGMVAVLNGSTSVNVTWKDNSSVESGYVVEGRVSSSGSFTELSRFPANTQTGTVTVAPGDTTEIRVRAYYNFNAVDYFSAAPATTTLTTVNGFQGRNYHPAVVGNPINAYTAQVGAAPARTSWSMVSGPAWASFNPANGQITGTPIEPGIFVVKLTATFADSSTDELDVTFRVAAQEGSPVSDGAPSALTIPLNNQITVPLSAWFTDPDSPSAVLVDTSEGDFSIILQDELTPDTVRNFRTYMNAGDYSGVAIHRAPLGFVVQSGGYKPTVAPSPDNKFTVVTKRPPVKNEPGLPNFRRTVAMAKSPGDPNSATSEFFVNMNDNRLNLDAQNGGFTVFGRVPDAEMGVLDDIFGSNYHTGDYSYQIEVNGNWLRGIFEDFPLKGPANTLTAESDGYKRVDKANMLSIQSITPRSTLSFTDLDNSNTAAVQATLDGTILTLTGLEDGNSSTIGFTIRDLDGSTITQSFVVTVTDGYEPPVIVSQPSGTTLLPDDDHLLSVTATGDALTYQWRKNGKPIPGAVNSTLNITDAELADDGVYQVWVSNASTTVGSTAVTVRVHVPAEIVTDPVSITRPFEGRASFSVVATGSPDDFVYQWLKNGSEITGATSATYTIPFLTMTHAGDYSCRVTNDFGTDTSAVATLTVQAFDRDNDGLEDHDEIARGTDRFNADTDGDGYNDSIEVTYSSDPKSATSNPASNIVSAKVEATALLGGIPMRLLPARTGFPNGLLTPPTVNIPQMWLSTYELTNAQFAAILQHAKDEMSGVISIVDNMGQAEVHSRGNLVCRLPTHKAADPGNLGMDEVSLSAQGDTFLVPKALADHPVRGVSWYAAYLAAEVMNDFFGYATKMDVPNTSFNFADFGFHIPRYVEWEFAARSGTTNQPFSTGATISGTKANYDASSFGKPKPVNSHVANATIGCFNLSGNVSEWVFEEDALNAGNNYTRGGGYDDPVLELQTNESTSRLRASLNASTGIRLALVDTRAPTAPVPPQPYVIVGTGSPITLTASATGAPPLAWQWFKDNRPLAGKTSATLTIPSATLNDAGVYKAVASNALGSVSTDTSVVTVVDTAPRTLFVKMGTSTTLTATSKGSTILAHNWLKDGEDLPEASGLSEGTGSAKLKITGPTELSTGVYRCEIIGPGLSGMVTSGPVSVIFVEKPVIGQQLIEPPVAVGGSLSFSALYDTVLYRTPTKWTITGLPPGMTYNPNTGVISGRATKSGIYNVKISASNPGGKSNTVTYRIAVQAFPAGSLGDFVGRLLPGTPPAQDDLGGRIDLKTTAAGTFTGSVVIEGVKYPIKGNLNTDAISTAAAVSSAKSSITLNVPRPNLPTIQLSLILDPSAQTLTGTAGPLVPPATAPASGTTVTIAGWRNRWAGSTNLTQNPRSGTQTLYLQMPGSELNKPEAPQGEGYATLTVALKGATNVVGKAADGSVISSSGWLGPNGDVLLFAAPYGAKGSLTGLLNVGATSNQEVTGTIRWLKKDLGATSTERNYKSGFGPYNLTAEGRVYTAPPAGQLIVSMPGGAGNAKITFSPLRLNTGGTALEGSETATFTLNSNHSVTLPTATATMTLQALTIKPKTGTFSGKVRFLDGAVTREALLEGVFVKDATANTAGTGRGFMLLPQLPNLPTSPLFSSKVAIERTP